jgi:hypothetical protein
MAKSVSNMKNSGAKGIGTMTYIAALAVLAVVVAVAFLSGAFGTGAQTTTTMSSSSTILSTTTAPPTTINPFSTTIITTSILPSSEVFAPVIPDFTRTGNVTAINASAASLQGASSGYVINYVSNQHANNTLLIRTLTYTNTTALYGQFGTMERQISNTTTPFSSGLPGPGAQGASYIGGKLKIVLSGSSIYLMATYSGTTIITINFRVSTSSGVSESTSKSVLLTAMDETKANLDTLG